MNDISSLVLSELQALRADYNENAREAGERLSSLEGSVKKLVGNGQKGMVDVLGDRVSSLEKYQSWVLGSAAGVTSVIGILAWIFMAIRK